MTSIALPRLRARRRRWKPKPPLWWVALFFVVSNLVWIPFDLLCVMHGIGSTVSNTLYAISHGAVIKGLWPLVLERGPVLFGWLAFGIVIGFFALTAFMFGAP